MSGYQVVGHVAHVRTQTPQGPMTRLLYKGSLLPDDVSPEQVRHLLDVKLIAPFGGVGGSDLPGAALPPPVGGEETAGGSTVRDAGNGDETGEAEGSETPYDHPDRVAARAKLPDDGSLPHHASGQPVWVEYLVSNGYDYAAVKGQDKSTLVELAKTASERR